VVAIPKWIKDRSAIVTTRNRTVTKDLRISVAMPYPRFLTESFKPGSTLLNHPIKDLN
ncbi:unnamed protein product, partial [Acidithrix sp. C25]